MSRVHRSRFDMTAPLVSRITASAALLLVAICAPLSSAKAQLFPWEWFQAPSQNPNATVYRVAVSPRLNVGEVYVSHRDRRLYLVQARGQALSYPIAAPRPGDLWQGVMPITRKATNPSWTPTAEMRRENPRLPAFVPGGHPRNPMGSHALYLGSSLYRIHGTDAPSTIGLPVSRGCIRMHNAHVAHLYNRVRIGTRVTVTYRSLRVRQPQIW